MATRFRLSCLILRKRLLLYSLLLDLHSQAASGAAAVPSQVGMCFGCALSTPKLPKWNCVQQLHQLFDSKKYGTNESSNEKHERRWNEMKLQHPVLCGQWTSRTLEASHRDRVGKEILEILGDTTLNADLFRCDLRQRDFSHLGVYLKGPQGTPYDCGWFAAKFDIPVGYPFRPPKFKILTKILHPNIGAESGEVCLDWLSAEGWSPVCTMHKVLLAVLVLQHRSPMTPWTSKLLLFSWTTQSSSQKRRDSGLSRCKEFSGMYRAFWNA